MDIQEYLQKTGTSQCKMARDLNISLTHFRGVMLKQNHPSRKLATAIELVTGGLVTKESVIFGGQ